LCWIKKYTNGTIAAKKAPAKYFLYFTAVGFLGLKAKTPAVQGMVATRYEIMKMSCQSWSSVDVTYVHPPQVKVRKTPTPATNFGNVAFGLRVRMYHNATSANRGPIRLQYNPTDVPL
jgi:hypothetical protein